MSDEEFFTPGEHADEHAEHHKRGRPKGSKNSLRELPDGPVDEMTGLTQRQQMVLIFLREEIAKRGYPPSMREIGAAVGLASTSSVSHQLRVLEQLGYVKRDANRPRALEIFLPEVLQARLKLRHEEGGDDTGIGDERPEATYVPVLGRIAAGGPILAEERVEEVMPMPRSLVGDGTLFMLEVRGDSMIDAGILDGDIALIRRTDGADTGDIVVALIDEEEATLKRFRRRGASIALEPANTSYEVRILPPNRVRIQGRMVGLFRKY